MVSSDGFVVDIFVGPPSVEISIPIDGTLINAKTDTIKFTISEFLDDYAINVSADYSTKYTFHSYWQPQDRQISLTFTGQFASADTLTITVDSLVDQLGLTTGPWDYKYHLPLLGDYNLDEAIDVFDLNQLVSYWEGEILAEDSISTELGPVSGEAPYFVLSPDSLFNLRDLMGFQSMWVWQHIYRPQGASVPERNSGAEPDIEQNGNQLVVHVPQGVQAGQIYLEPGAVPVTFQRNEDLSDDPNLITLLHTFENQSTLVEYATFKGSNPQTIIVFTIDDIPEGDKSVMVNYRFLDDKSDIIGQGNKTVKIRAIPTVFSLHKNYPNPFNPVTTLKYDLPEAANVKLTIYDITGRTVKTLVNSHQEAGYKSIRWDSTNDLGEPVSAGMYLYRIRAGQ